MSFLDKLHRNDNALDIRPEEELKKLFGKRKDKERKQERSEEQQPQQDGEAATRFANIALHGKIGGTKVDANVDITDKGTKIDASANGDVALGKQLKAKVGGDMHAEVGPDGKVSGEVKPTLELEREKAEGKESEGEGKEGEAGGEKKKKSKVGKLLDKAIDKGLDKGVEAANKGLEKVSEKSTIKFGGKKESVDGGAVEEGPLEKKADEVATKAEGETKADAKTETKTESKADAKTETKADAKTETKADDELATPKEAGKKKTDVATKAQADDELKEPANVVAEETSSGDEHKHAGPDAKKTASDDELLEPAVADAKPKAHVVTQDTKAVAEDDLKHPTQKPNSLTAKSVPAGKDTTHGKQKPHELANTTHAGEHANGHHGVGTKVGGHVANNGVASNAFGVPHNAANERFAKIAVDNDARKLGKETDGLDTTQNTGDGSIDLSDVSFDPPEVKDATDAPNAVAHVRGKANAEKTKLAATTQHKVAAISTSSAGHAAQVQHHGQQQIQGAQVHGEQQKVAAHAQAEAKKVEKAKSIDELKARLDESWKKEEHELKEGIEHQKAELKHQIAEEKAKLDTEIKGQEGRLKAQIEQKNGELEAKIAAKKHQLEEQAQAQIKQAETATKAQELKVRTAGDEEARRIETQGKSEADKATKTAHTQASQIRTRARNEAAQARHEGEAQAQEAQSGTTDAEKKQALQQASAARAAASHRASEITSRAEAEASKIEAAAQAEASKRKANAHEMAAQMRAKTNAQVQALEGKLVQTKAKLMDIGPALDAERQAMAAENAKFIEAARAAFVKETEASNARLNAHEKEGLEKIEAIEKTNKKTAQQKHDDMLIKLEAGNASQLAALEAETNKSIEAIEKNVAMTKVAAHQQAEEIQANAARQTNDRIAAVRAQADAAAQKIDQRALAAEQKIEASSIAAAQKIKATGEQHAADTAASGDGARLQLKQQGDKAVSDLQKSTAEFERQKAEDAAAAAAAEKKKAAEAAAKAAEEKHKEEEAKKAEERKKAEFQARAKGAAEDLVGSFHWYGNDDKKIVAALSGKTPEELAAIKDAYKAKTGRDLEKDFEKEMSGAHLKEAKSLLSTDPVQQAVAALETSKGGMFGIGTDKKKILDTLNNIKDPAVKQQVIDQYEQQTGERLNKMLADSGMQKAGLNPEDFKLEKKGPSVDPEEVKKAAQSKDVKLAASAILAATDRWGTDEKAIFTALRGKSPTEIAAIRQAFKEHSGGKDLDAVLEDELSGTELKEAKALLSDDPVRKAVASLQNAADGLGTDKEKIHETLKEITDPEIRRQVQHQYEKQTGQKLDAMLKDELSGFDRDLAQAYAKGDKSEIAATEADKAMHGGFLTDIADGIADTVGADRKAVRGAVAGPLLTMINGKDNATDLGTDNEGLYKALEQAKTPEERDALRKAYKARTGNDLDKDVEKDLEGKEKDVGKYILAGDKDAAEAAKMKAAADGFGTDRKAIYGALEKCESKEERERLVKKYNELYGKEGETFDAMLKSEMGDLDYEKAKALEKSGKMDDGFALYYATHQGLLGGALGIGTDDELMKERLKGKSKEEIAQLRKDYAAAASKYGKQENADLDKDILSKTSGRTGHELKQDLKGNPTTLEEARQRADEDYQFERHDSGWVGEVGMFVMTGPIGYAALKAQGVQPSDLSNGVTDIWSGSGKRLDQTHAEVEAEYARIKADPKYAEYSKFPPGSPERAAMDKEMLAQLQGKTDWQEGDLKGFREAKDAAAEVAGTAAAIAVGAVVSIASGGTAAPAVVALISGLAGLSTTMIMKGASMSNEEVVQSLAATIADAASAGFVKLEAIEKLVGNLGRLAGGNNLLVAEIVKEACEQTMVMGSDELIKAMLNPENYKGDLADWAKGVAKQTGHGAREGFLTGMVAGGAGRAIPDTKTMPGRMAKGAATQVIGATTTAIVNPETYEGSVEEKWSRFGRSAGEAGLIGARDAMGGGPHIDLHAKGEGGNTHAGNETHTAKSTTEHETSTSKTKTETSSEVHPETKPVTKSETPVDEHSLTAKAEKTSKTGEETTVEPKTEPKTELKTEPKTETEPKKKEPLLLEAHNEPTKKEPLLLPEHTETSLETKGKKTSTEELATNVGEMLGHGQKKTGSESEAPPVLKTEFKEAQPGHVPTDATPEQIAAFKEANEAYERLKNNKFGIYGEEFARLAWAEQLKQAGITVETGVKSVGSKERAVEAKNLGREEQRPQHKSDAVLDGESSMGKRSPTQPNINEHQSAAAFAEVAHTLKGVEVVSVTGVHPAELIVRIPGPDGTKTELMIKLLHPDVLPDGQMAAMQKGNNEMFVWLNQRTPTDQIPRVLGGIIQQAIAGHSGGDLTHAGQAGQLDAMIGRLKEVQSAKPEYSTEPKDLLATQVAKSKRESPERIQAEIDLQLMRMGLDQPGPAREEALAKLPAGQQAEVRAYLESRKAAIGFNAEGVIDESKVAKPTHTGEKNSSTVLADTPESTHAYSEADRIKVAELRIVIEQIKECDSRLKERDVKGTQQKGQDQIAQGESLRRRELIERQKALLADLQLGGSDKAYYEARLKELDGVFPGVAQTIKPTIDSRLEGHAQAEKAKAEAAAYREKAKEASKKIEDEIKNGPDPFLGGRMVVGDGIAGLSNIATLGHEVGEGGFMNPKDCLVVGGMDLVQRMANADGNMKWGQRAGLFDKGEGGEKGHQIFSEHGKSTGELQRRNEDSGDFMTVGELSDSMDLARERMGVARVGAKVLQVELQSKNTGEPWPEAAKGHEVRATLQFADGTTKQIYLQHADLTVGLGNAMLTDSSILSNKHKDQLFKNNVLVGGEELMTGKNVEGKRVLVMGYGPTGGWASYEAAKRGAAAVDWTGSSGQSEGHAKDNASGLEGLKSVDRVQEAFDAKSKVNISSDRVLSIKPNGTGAEVTFVRKGEGGQLESYTVQYDHIVMALPPNNTGKERTTKSTDGTPNAGTMLSGIDMQPQKPHEDGTAAPVLESKEGNGAIRVMGAAAADGVNLTEAQQAEMKERSKQVKLSADSPDNRVMEFAGEAAELANKNAKQKHAEQNLTTSVAGMENTFGNELSAKDTKLVGPSEKDKPVLHKSAADALIGLPTEVIPANLSGADAIAQLEQQGIPRWPALTKKERMHEEAFLKEIEQPGALKELVERFTAMSRDKEGVMVFEVDGAKKLYSQYGTKKAPETAGEVDVRATANHALHPAAVAITRAAFLKGLDEIASLPEGDPRKNVFVTNGGCAAGKGSLTDIVKGQHDGKFPFGVVWDAAGEGDAQENGWILQAAQQRGLKVTYGFVQNDPMYTYNAVLNRALLSGRIVDPVTFARSYANGQKNMHEFMESEEYKAAAKNGQAETIGMYTGKFDVSKNAYPDAHKLGDEKGNINSEHIEGAPNEAQVTAEAIKIFKAWLEEQRAAGKPVDHWIEGGIVNTKKFHPKAKPHEEKVADTGLDGSMEDKSLDWYTQGGSAADSHLTDEEKRKS